MKKALLAAAVLAAAAPSAFAADVTLYGRFDLGVNYTHAKSGIDKAVNKVEMAGGNSTSNRWGLKGEEKLGGSVRVKFVLENGYDTDTGGFRTSGRIFDREASLQLVTPYGTFAGGRLTILGTDGGSFNLLGNVSAMGTGVGDTGNQNTVFGKIPGSRYDNVLAYRSPVCSGFQLTAEYAMGANGEENKSSSDRYAGVGVTYKAAPVETVLLVESVNEAAADAKKDPHDLLRVTAGGNYAIQNGHVYLAAQYFRNADGLGAEGYGVLKENGLGSLTASAVKGFDRLKGYGLAAGADYDAFGGTLMFTAGAMSAKTTEAASELKAKGMFSALGYFYPLSKRTRLYGSVGYAASRFKADGRKLKPEAVYTTMGMAHYF